MLAFTKGRHNQKAQDTTKMEAKARTHIAAEYQTKASATLDLEHIRREPLFTFIRAWHVPRKKDGVSIRTQGPRPRSVG